MMIVKSDSQYRTIASEECKHFFVMQKMCGKVIIKIVSLKNYFI